MTTAKNVSKGSRKFKSTVTQDAAINRLHVGKVGRKEPFIAPVCGENARFARRNATFLVAACYVATLAYQKIFGAVNSAM